MFICIEGADGVGKATQSSKLAEKFAERGRDVLLVHFPRYDTPLGQSILRHLKREIMVREQEGASWHGGVAPEDALVFQCMMLADKCEAAVDIRAALDRGKVVICDRWWQSAYAYGAADGLSPEWLLRVHRCLPQADVNFLIDLDPEEARRRRPELRDRYEQDREKQARVRRYYLDLWSAHGYFSGSRRNWIVVDGSGDADQVHACIWENL